jgi:hypothetical protein
MGHFDEARRLGRDIPLIGTLHARSTSRPTKPIPSPSPSCIFEFRNRYVEDRNCRLAFQLLTLFSLLIPKLTHEQCPSQPPPTP